MKIDTNDLVSIGQIAERAGVMVSAVSNWRNRYEDFPEPVWEDGRTAAFLWWQVEAWMEHHGKPSARGR